LVINHAIENTMQELIASFLFQNNSCPLPGLGTLSVRTSGAVSDFTEKKIGPPTPEIRFDPNESNAAALLGYLARKTNSAPMDALEALKQYCNELKSDISTNQAASLPGVGKFYVDANGKLGFTPEVIPAGFLKPVPAERVIHPEASHAILVGDKETTSTEMTEYFNETVVKKDRWWIWATLLGVVGLIILLYYFTDLDRNALFGNAVKL
jgi:nucleoid DNA-binding protein